MLGFRVEFGGEQNCKPLMDLMRNVKGVKDVAVFAPSSCEKVLLLTDVDWSKLGASP